MFVCLFIFMKGMLLVLVNGFSLESCRCGLILGMVWGGSFLIVWVMVVIWLGVDLQQLLIMFIRFLCVNFSICVVMFLGDLLYWFILLGRFVLGQVQISVFVMIDSLVRCGCIVLVFRVQFRFMVMGWVCVIEYQNVVGVCFDSVWFDRLVIVFEIIIGSCRLLCVNIFLQVKIVVLVFSVLKIVLIRIRLVLLLISLWICLVQVMCRLLNVIV